MTDKIESLLSQRVDLSALPHDTARYVENLRGMLEEVKTQRDIVMGNRLGLYWSAKSYEERFDDWRNDAVVPVLDEALSRPEDDAGNLIIEGDNIDALRVLSRTHKGKVDCIFIDPPYNTENTTFVYNDDYVAKEDKYRYSMWLEGLKRRLEYVPDLLSERGVLLVAINDENRAYIELLIKEQIMPGNFIGSFVWRCRTNGKSPWHYSLNHEHVLVFANSNFKFRGVDREDKEYTFNHPSGEQARLITLTQGHGKDESPKSFFPIHDQVNDVWYPCDAHSVWRNNREGIEALRVRGALHFPPESKKNPIKTFNTREEFITAVRNKEVPHGGKGAGRRPLFTEAMIEAGTIDPNEWVGRRISWGRPSRIEKRSEATTETKAVSSWMAAKEADLDADEGIILSRMNQEATDELSAIFGGEKVFNYAKPPTLAINLLRQATGPNSLVLDFFGGSGTTAEAVLRLNAEDGGDRRFIMVSNTEHTDKEPDKNLCRDVLRRRVNAVMDGFTKGKKEVNGTGGGYAYMRMERHIEEVICGPNPFELSWEMAVSLCQMSFGLPVAPLALTPEGFAVIETEETAFIFVPEWSKPLAPMIAAEFAARPGKEHVMVSDFDRTPTAQLREIGCESAKCVDAYVIAGRLCGPAPVRGA